MQEFEPLIGEWHGEGEIPIEPPMKIAADVSIERLGEFIVMRSTGEPAEMPDSISIIGGAPAGEPQPMHYFDSRGVKRLFMTTPGLPKLRKSVGGKKQPTHWILLEARSTASPALGSPGPPLVPSMSDRCPPADPPDRSFAPRSSRRCCSRPAPARRGRPRST